MNHTLSLTLILCCVFYFFPTKIQAQISVSYSVSDHQASPLVKGTPLLPKSATVKDTLALSSLLKNQLAQLQSLGYLTSSFDSVVRVNDTSYEVITHLGPVYQWAEISLDSIPIGILNKLSIRKLDWSGKKIDPLLLNKLKKKIVGHYENNGYPFAQVLHKYTLFSPSGISTQLIVQKGQELKIDTIITKDNVDIAPSFLHNYIGIQQGSLYQEHALKTLSNKLKELPFLQEDQPWEMNHTIAKNELILHLKKRKSNQINGLIGLQPNTVETGKMLLTVDALLDLKNSFGFGESIMASYQNLQKGSPKLTMGVQAPYILGLPMAIDGNFYLYKRDSLYTKVNFDLGARYLFNAKEFLKLSYINLSYRVNKIDFEFIAREKRLPDIIDTRSNGIGLQLFLDKTDYNLAPRKGWLINFNSQLLQRSIKENVAITTFEDGSTYDYSKLYDTFTLSSNQYKLFGKAEWYQPIYKTIIGKVGYQGGWMQGENLFLNELYQIGGFHILRGFDEESIFTNHYHVASLELRFSINTYSYFYGFSDFGWVQSSYNGTTRNNKPMSVGAGLSLQNDGGIFRIAIGVGKNENEPLRMRQAKLHFGYTALF